MPKKNIFWYLIIPWLILITLFISLSPWLLELLATPPNRVFSGINRWSTDYFIYLSYIEQGRRGFLPVKLLLTTQPHPALYTHLVYTIPGYIFGHILGLDSILIYHLFRALYGLIFLITAVIFFYLISNKNKIITLSAFFLAFYISGSSHHLSWLQEQNIIGRASGPLHYSAGFVVFLATFLYFFYSKNRPLKKTLIFGLLLNLLLLTNPFNYLVIGISFGGYLILKSGWFVWKGFRQRAIPLKTLTNNRNKKNYVLSISQITKNHFDEHWREGKRKQVPLFNLLIKSFATGPVIIILGFLLSLPTLLYLNHHLSTKPWGVIGVSPKFYVITTPPVGFLEASLSIGPIFFLGIMGIIICLAGVATKGPPQRGSLLRQPSNFKDKINSVLSICQFYKRHSMSTGGNEVATGPAIITFIIIWPTVQFLLLLFGHHLKIHPPRAFSGLYYLPLAYFSAVIINQISHLLKKKIEIGYQKTENRTEIRNQKLEKTSFLFPFSLLISVFKQLFSNFRIFFLLGLFLTTFPNYIQFYKQHLYAFTDFQNFSPFVYPTKKQLEAYRFLEKNTPFASGVLAMFEASNHLMGFSGNSVELEMDHQIKTDFYANKMTDKEAKIFLIKNRFQYVYWGPQEKSAAGQPDRYFFLKKIFDNKEVKIYKLINNLN